MSFFSHVLKILSVPGVPVSPSSTGGTAFYLPQNSNHKDTAILAREPCPLSGETPTDRSTSSQNDFTFTLNEEETGNMFSGYHLNKRWSDILFRAFCRSPGQPKCVLAARYRHMRKPGSQKTRAPFFTCHARCRLPGCHTYTLSVAEAPTDGKAIVRCQRYGSSTDAHRQFHAHRYLAGTRRFHLAGDVQQRGPYLVRQELISAAPSDQLADGNITEAPPAKILRQAAYERRLAERYSADWAEDIASTMDVSRSEDTTSTVIFGGIHLIGKCPLVVHMYREHFLRKFSASPSTLHIDATGSITKQVGAKRPYMYAVIAECEGGSYPLAHLLAESHTVPTIAHFLAQLSRDCKLVTKAPLGITGPSA